MQDLPLQVSEIDRVTVGQHQPADTRRSKVQRSRRTQASRTDNQDACGSKPLLAFDPDFVKQDVPAVTQQFLVVQDDSL